MRFFLFTLLLSFNAIYAADYDVIVIGAGISGIAAARELHEKGLKVVVFEASNRVGGRTYTGTIGGVPVDFGASWIHGVKDNPIMALAEKYHIKTVPFDYDSVDLYSPDGRLQTKEEMDHLYEIEDSLYKTIRYEQDEQDEDMPLQTALTPWINSYTGFDRLAAKFWLSSDVEDEYGADASDLSLYYFDADSELKGGDHFIPFGYKQLIDALADPLPILLNQCVNRIDYSNEGVVIGTNRGSYTANYAICTIPLGDLKADKILFNPILPAKKKGAIDRLKMGVLHKTILYFPNVFWDDRVANMGYIPVEQGRWVYFVNLHKFNGAPILVGFNQGSYAKELEKMSDSQVKDKMMEVLRLIYGSSIPEPLYFTTSRWQEDGYSYGSYSHIPVGATEKDYDEMGEPLGRLHFAGEATLHTYPGTVHGAYMSGLREAERIMKNLKPNF